MAYVATGALTRPVRGRGFLQLCLVILLAGGLVTACGGEPAEQTHRKLVWSDEFEGAAGASPDPAHWVHDTGGHGWGNHELQCYTKYATTHGLTDDGGHWYLTRNTQVPAVTSDFHTFAAAPC